METDAYLWKISRQEKQFDALYRSAGANFDLSDCAMWVLYFLSSVDTELSQQDLIEMMMFPAQTINSAVSSLAKKDLLELKMIPGTRNRKRISLTQSGRDLAEQTIDRMRKAECRAVEAMGCEKIEKFIDLYQQFFGCLKTEFEKEGLIYEEQ